MAMDFNISELVAIASANATFNPFLAETVNQLIQAKNKPQYEILLKEATDLALGYTSQIPIERNDYGKGSFFGLPLFQPLTLIDENNNELFLESAVIRLNRSKNIVKTVVQGRDSSVKEFINNGDFLLDVSGILFTNTHEYPLDEVIAFNGFMALNTNLSVQHEVLNALDIFEIVIEDYAMNETTHLNIQPFRFSAVSDTPIELNILDLPG